MTERTKTYLINFIAGFVVAVAVFILSMQRDYTVLRALCDSFFVAAVLLLGIGGIKFVRNKGAFDVAGYGLKTALHMNLPFLNNHSPLENREEPFEDYRERVQSKRKSAAGELIPGLVYMALSLVMLGIYSI